MLRKSEVIHAILWKKEENVYGGDSKMAGALEGVTVTFTDKNGKPFIIQVIGEERWRKGLENTGLADELDKVGCAKLGDIAASPKKRKTFTDTMDRLFATNTREHWLSLLREADVVSAPINNVDVITNQYIIEIGHPKVGKIKEVGFPWKFHKTPAKAGIAPELGEHNNEILNIRQLKDEKII
jgi:crotonobetainyl-CoA:carnitine CoA-transferase CaiB-like acyl-CoA transferase